MFPIRGEPWFRKMSTNSLRRHFQNNVITQIQRQVSEPQKWRLTISRGNLWKVERDQSRKEQKETGGEIHTDEKEKGREISRIWQRRGWRWSAENQLDNLVVWPAIDWFSEWCVAVDWKIYGWHCSVILRKQSCS